MKNLIITLLLFLAFKSWGQSPAFNFSSSSSVLQPIFELKQDADNWQQQPASFVVGADYLIPFGKKDFISFGVQYRKWQYRSNNVAFYRGCWTPPLSPEIMEFKQLNTHQEMAIPVQFWLYSKEKAWQTFIRVGFTPSYVFKTAPRKEEMNFYGDKLLEEDFRPWNFSTDFSLGLQRKLFHKMHAYLAVNSQLYLRKNQLYARSNSYQGKRYTNVIQELKPYHKLGIGLELGIQYRLK